MHDKHKKLDLSTKCLKLIGHTYLFVVNRKSWLKLIGHSYLCVANQKPWPETSLKNSGLFS